MRQADKRFAKGEGEAPRANLYDEVTAKIIAQLETGCFPWVQPWGSAGCTAPGLPRNALTGRAYSGVNILVLWGAVIDGGWPSQGWLTFRQALEAGGSVRKGEKGTTVVYADELAWLSGCIAELGQAVHTICVERISELQAKAEGEAA